VIIQENHSFDNYFGKYCKAPVGSNPTCTSGPECCEAGPTQVSGYSPLLLTDQQNLAYDPDHSSACELDKMNQGKMDKFVVGGKCSSPNTFAYADADTVGVYWDYAANYSMADRYFQPSAGASSENDMYFARAAFVFEDNSLVPDTAGKQCYPPSQHATYNDATLGDLLLFCGVSWSFYSEGYDEVLNNPSKCLEYPHHYDPSDNPFQYYKRFQDNPVYQKDYGRFISDVSAQTLPAVSFIKPLGIRSEHPVYSKITEGERFIKEVVDSLLKSPIYSKNTLILLVPDESGGYYDHISPPPPSSVDHQPYGPRVPFLAIGHFAKKNMVSHVVMEHSSIVRFIEWNFLSGDPGQLKTRDAVVNGIGSLLDPSKTGIEVP
jgi:phospholipase C